MDIRRKTTYLSRTSDGRQTQCYSSFFKSAQKKYYNIDPESGMHLVGPMFELTACIELRGDEDDFDAVYPDSSMSFGPTICSFGLKYNDHNYAMPSGLTPPSMAPHLMDSRQPRDKKNSETHCSRAIFADDHMRPNKKLISVIDANLDQQVAADSRNSASESCRSAEMLDDPDRKQRSTGSWYTSNSAEPSPLAEQCYRELPSDSPRFGKSSGNFESMEVRYEPELKVIEVPEELAVSPSQLSDLDTDESILGEKVILTDRCSTGVNVDGSIVNGSVWPKLRCICSRVFTMEKLIQCPSCSLFQHVQCMEEHYSVSLPNLAEGYICPHCGADAAANRSSDRSSAVVTNTQHIQLVHPDMTSHIGDEKAGYTTDPRVQPDRSIGEVSATGAQYVDLAADKARQLGLLSATLRIDNPRTARPCISACYSSGFGKLGDRNLVKEPDTRVGLAGVDWDRLNELSRCARRPPGDTNINLRVPSPPRASKRKQDLSSKSYKELDTNAQDPGLEKRVCSSDPFSMVTPDDSSASATPLSTPTSTPYKLQSSETPTTSRLMTPNSDCSSSSGLDSPLRPNLRGEKRRHRFGRALFTDNLTPDKRALSIRSHPLGSAWTKDYQEAETNAYSKALSDHIEQHLSSGVEHNHRIPPTCLTRSSLCRVVLFDHDDKGLEASARLSLNEVVTEVRGNFLLLEEYEHYVDPTTEYNRYVMFYRGFSDRAIVVDTSQYGNSARFIRRSCVPNCRLDHCVVQGKLQLVIRTTSEIMPGTELTLPFDLDYRACRYPLDCACARSRCPVLRWRRKLVRNKVVPNLDYSKYIESQLRVLSKPLTQDSPNTKGGSTYDPIGLTGSPLVRTTSGSQSARPVSQFSSPTLSSSTSKDPPKRAVGKHSMENSDSDSSPPPTLRGTDRLERRSVLR